MFLLIVYNTAVGISKGRTHVEQLDYTSLLYAIRNKFLVFVLVQSDLNVIKATTRTKWLFKHFSYTSHRHTHARMFKITFTFTKLLCCRLLISIYSRVVTKRKMDETDFHSLSHSYVLLSFLLTFVCIKHTRVSNHLIILSIVTHLWHTITHFHQPNE